MQHLISQIEADEKFEVGSDPKKRRMNRILVTADSNKAVDRITESLIEAGILVARIPSIGSIPNPFFKTSKIVQSRHVLPFKYGASKKERKEDNAV